MTSTSARHPTCSPGPNGLWTLSVPWKTRAIRGNYTVAASAFPTAPWTPQAAPTGTTGFLLDAHLQRDHDRNRTVAGDPGDASRRLERPNAHLYETEQPRRGGNVRATSRAVSSKTKYQALVYLSRTYRHRNTIGGPPVLRLRVNASHRIGHNSVENELSF